MIGVRRLLRRLRSVMQRQRQHQEYDDEFQFHIDMEAARLQREGKPQHEALALARRTFGKVLTVREQTRDSHGVRAIDDFMQDMRFGIRSLLRNRVFAGASILTLAIGIGATTAIFGAVYAVLLAPMPFAESERIMTLWETSTDGSGTRDDVAPGNFLDWTERQQSFDALAAAEPYSMDFVGRDGPERISSSVVTKDFFRIFGVAPFLGRTFVEDDFTTGGGAVVILSERVWRTRFGADSAIVGQALVLDSVPMIVVGVMPVAFDLPHDRQAWTPKIFRPDERESRASAYYSVFGRLAPGVSVEAAESNMRSVAAEFAAKYPTTNAKTSVIVLPLTDALVGNARTSLWLLLGAVAFVLLIACANVAGLQLAQALRRSREFAIRSALGAGRGRLMRQLLTEGLVLSLVGGSMGILVAAWGAGVIRGLGPDTLPQLAQLKMNVPMLLFAVAIAVLTTMLFGAVPVLHATGLRIGSTIGNANSRAATGSRLRRRAQRTLVGAEVALAFTLLVGSGLLVRSFVSLLRVDRGFDATGVVNVTVQAWGYYPTAGHRIAFVRDAVTRLGELPTITHAGVTSSLPLAPSIGQDRAAMTIQGYEHVGAQDRPSIHIAVATADYFATLGIPIQTGRTFAGFDSESGAPVAIVNQAFATRYWPGESPIGKQLTFRFQGPVQVRTVVGVAGNVRHDGLQSDPAPSVFVPYAQAPTGALQIVARTSADVVQAERAVRQVLGAMNGVMPLTDATTLDALLNVSLRERRFHLALISAFSVAALVLASVGIFGLMNQLTSERTQEIGVRLAIGANAPDVLRMVLRQGMTIAASGLLVGLLLSFSLTQFMGAMLFQIRPLDPATFVIAIIVLGATTCGAIWLPARRASLLDPARVLRSD